jgi:phospholipase/carboxylesterase
MRITRARALPFAVLTAIAALAVASEGLAITPAGLERKALAAMERGAYDEATAILTELLERVPEAPRPLYNLACCASRLGDLGDAAEHLRAAWDAGFRDLEFIRSDPDLQPLRESRRGKKLIKRLEAEHRREQRLRGAPLLFEAPVLAGARVVAPATLEPDRRYPLVVALHGNGGSADRFAGLFVAAGLDPDVIVVAPQGPYPTRQLNGFGYSWFPSPDLFAELVDVGDASKNDDARRQTLEQREIEVSTRHILAAIDAVEHAYPVDREAVYVLGFSQGGVLAYTLGLNHPHRFTGLIAIGTLLRLGHASPETIAAAAGEIRALVCHSPMDEAVAIDEGKAAARRLHEAGVDTRFVRYDGGHQLTAGLLATVARWIEGSPLEPLTTGSTFTSGDGSLEQ